MAKKILIELNHEGIAQLLKSAEMVGEMKRVADGVAARAGQGYSAEAGTKGKTRGRAFVQTDDWASFEDNATNSTLLRALDGG